MKAFAQEDWEIGRYQDRLEQSYQLSLKKISEVAKFTGLLSTLGAWGRCLYSLVWRESCH